MQSNRYPIVKCNMHGYALRIKVLIFTGWFAFYLLDNTPNGPQIEQIFADLKWMSSQKQNANL